MASTTQEISTEFDLRPIHHYEHIAPYLHLLPPVHPCLLSSDSRRWKTQAQISKILTRSPFVTFSSETIQAQQASPQKGYLAFGENFNFWLDLSDGDFAACIDALHGEMQLLLWYFLLVLLMMLSQGVVENHDGLESHTSRHVDGILGWIHNCLRNVPYRLKDMQISYRVFSLLPLLKQMVYRFQTRQSCNWTLHTAFMLRSRLCN